MTLTEAIHLLGNSKEDVSAKLREMGIKGSMFSAGWCPIARYCKAQTNAQVLIADTASRFEEGAEGASERVELPEHVKQWVIDFDAGLLPDFNISL